MINKSNKLTLEQRITRLETLVRRFYKNESVSQDDAELVADAADKLCKLLENARKHGNISRYAEIKKIDAGNNNYINWAVTLDDGSNYTSYDLLQGKDEDYEPIGGIDLLMSGNDGKEEWSLSKKHFNTVKELLNYVRKDYDDLDDMDESKMRCGRRSCRFYR